MAKNFKPETVETAPADLSTVLKNRYDVNIIAELFVDDNYCERLDQAIFLRIAQYLAGRPKPQIIDVPVVAGSFLEGVSYADPE